MLPSIRRAGLIIISEPLPNLSSCQNYLGKTLKSFASHRVDSHDLVALNALVTFLTCDS